MDQLHPGLDDQKSTLWGHAFIVFVLLDNAKTQESGTLYTLRCQVSGSALDGTLVRRENYLACLPILKGKPRPILDRLQKHRFWFKQLCSCQWHFHASVTSSSASSLQGNCVCMGGGGELGE